MRETSTPLLVSGEDYRNVTDLLVRRAQEAPEHAAFEVPDAAAGGWRAITTQGFLADVKALAKGLIATGIEPGDVVAIMAPTRYHWAVADLATLFAGAVVVPIYDTSSQTQVTAIAADAHVRLAMTGTEAQSALLREAFAETTTGQLGVWGMDSAGDASGTLADLANAGQHISAADLEQRRILAGADEPATIVYTSGTTGEPKGAILTHRNFLGQVLNTAAAYGEVVRSDGNTIIFLPLAHVLARALQLICISSGMRIAHLADPAEVVPSLAVLRPTFLVVVPRVLQKIQAAAAKQAAAKRVTPLWNAAVATAVAVGRRLERGAPLSLALRVRRAFFDRLFFGRLRAVMGGQVGYILSGGASLDAELSLFFLGMGVPVIEGYGLTETTAPLTGNLPGDIRAGTVGHPLPGSTVRISDEGEILARGVGVFSGYKNPAHNATAFVDGFFRTGDLGSLDSDGRLILEGRLKDVIVTSNGKTIVPSSWELCVEASPIVAHAIMVGNDRPYLSALIMLDLAETNEWLAARSLAPLPTPDATVGVITEPHLRAAVQRLVDNANALVARSEQVRAFTVIATDLQDTRLVTPTLKVKRRVALERAVHVVDEQYS